jgi:hypothetical protein
MEEVIKDVTDYIWKLIGVMPAVRIKANQRAMQVWTDHATAVGVAVAAKSKPTALAVADTGLPAIRSGWLHFECRIVSLEKCQGNLLVALETVRDPPVKRALLLHIAAVAEMEDAL